MENAAERRLDDLKGIRGERRLGLLRESGEMIDDEMMQAG